jgi:hypothetical protein
VAAASRSRAACASPRSSSTMASNTSPQPEPRTASCSATPRTAARMASQPALAASSPHSPYTIAMAAGAMLRPTATGRPACSQPRRH